MKNSSQESIRNLFNLDNNVNIAFKFYLFFNCKEIIYDDFGCSFIDGIIFHGRIFITESHICFNSNILGFKKKVIILIKIKLLF